MTTALQIACVLPLLAANVLACRYIHALWKARRQRRELQLMTNTLLVALAQERACESGESIARDGLSN